MFIDRLKQARTAKGISQKELAEKIHVSQQAYAKYETGDSSPNPETLAGISKILNVSTDYLLGLTDDPHCIVLYGKGPYGQILPQGDKKSRTIIASAPISILAGQYNVDAKMLSSIAGIDYDLADRLCNNSSCEMMSEENYRRTAEFFELSADDLKAGIVPLFPKESVQIRMWEKKGKVLSDKIDRVGFPVEKLPEEERRLVELYRSLDLKDRGRIEGRMEEMLENSTQECPDASSPPPSPTRQCDLPGLPGIK